MGVILKIFNNLVSIYLYKKKKLKQKKNCSKCFKP